MGSPVHAQLGQKNSLLRAKCLAANKEKDTRKDTENNQSHSGAIKIKILLYWPLKN